MAMMSFKLRCRLNNLTWKNTFARGKRAKFEGGRADEQASAIFSPGHDKYSRAVRQSTPNTCCNGPICKFAINQHITKWRQRSSAISRANLHILRQSRWPNWITFNSITF